MGSVTKRCICLCFLSVEIDLMSFCKFIGPVNYSHLQHLRLDGNNLTQASMPVESVNCLRVASEIMFDENA